MLAVAYKRKQTGEMPKMPKMPKMPQMPQRMWRARDYVATATSAQKSQQFDPSENHVNESAALSMEDSAADEFIDMRVPTERAPMVSTAARSGTLETSGSFRSSATIPEESGGFGGGFGGGGGSGIGRGGIGRLNRPTLGRNGSSRTLGNGVNGGVM
jgi:hypothetical protein